jgi:hypothetical protein
MVLALALELVPWCWRWSWCRGAGAGAGAVVLELVLVLVLVLVRHATTKPQQPKPLQKITYNPATTYCYLQPLGYTMHPCTANVQHVTTWSPHHERIQSK